MSYLIYALAVWRLAHMLVKEEGPYRLIVQLREHFPLGGASSCVSCMSLWVALLLAPAPGWVRWVLAGSGLAKLVEDYFYNEDVRIEGATLAQRYADDEELASPFGARGMVKESDVGAEIRSFGIRGMS